MWDRLPLVAAAATAHKGTSAVSIIKELINYQVKTQISVSHRGQVLLISPLSARRSSWWVQAWVLSGVLAPGTSQREPRGADCEVLGCCPHGGSQSP